MKTITTHGRLTANQQRWVVKRITLHHKYGDIKKAFEEKFGRSINPMTIVRLKKKYLDVVTENRALIVRDGAISAASMKQQSYRLIQKRMDWAETDVSELEKLRGQYRRGEISAEDYKRQRQAYEELTISELTNVANSAHSHMKGNEDEAPNPGDQAALQMLMEGIKSGNPVQLIQVLNPPPNQTPKSPPASAAFPDPA